MKKMLEKKFVRLSLLGLSVLLLGVLGLSIYNHLQPNAYKLLLDESLKVVQQNDTKVAYETIQVNGNHIIVYSPVDEHHQPNKQVYDRLKDMQKRVEQTAPLPDTVYVVYAVQDASLLHLDTYQFFIDTYRYDKGKYHKQMSVHDTTLLLMNDTSLSLTQLLNSAKFDGKAFVQSLIHAIRTSALNAEQKAKIERMVTVDTLNQIQYIYSSDRVAMKFTVVDEGDYYIALNPELIVPYFNPSYIYDTYKKQYAVQIAQAMEQQLSKEQEYAKNFSAEMEKRQVGKKIALTFDDGPLPGYTDRVLDILKKYDAKATFYIVGRRVSGGEDILKRQLAEGHELGNHTWSHPNLTKEEDDRIVREIYDTQEAIRQATGVTPRTLRAPFGAYNGRVGELANMPLVNWSVDSYDWQTRDTRKNVSAVLRHTEPGDIILMHDIHEESVQAVEEIVSTLKQRGYEFVTVSELIDESNLMNNMIYFSATDARSTVE